MSANKVSRRKFFKIVGLALAGSAVACCGLSYAAAELGRPAAAARRSPVEQVETPDFTFGMDKANMKQRILVAYATRTGSTVGVAAAIGETLTGRGYAVDVRPMSENPDPSAYQAVVVGSAVNGGKWLPEAVDFVRQHQQAFKQTPLALFCVHILNLGDNETARKNRQAYLNEVRALVTPKDEAFFSGKGMDPKETAPILLWIMRTTRFVPEGDCRDWDKIRAWAQTLFA